MGSIWSRDETLPRMAETVGVSRRQSLSRGFIEASEPAFKDQRGVRRFTSGPHILKKHVGP
jgi:hypothetical protein